MKAVTLLAGGNHIQLRDYLEKELKSIAKDDISIYYPKEAEPGIIFSQCYQNSLFGGNNVVIVKECAELKDNPSKKKEFTDSLSKYLNSFNPDTNLFIEWEKPPKKILDIFKKNSKQLEIVRFKRVYKNELLSYARKRFREESIRFEEPVLDFLMTMTNEDQEELDMVLRKVVDYARDKGEITLEGARDIISRSHNLDIFAFLDRFFVRDIGQSLSALQDLKLNPKTPLILINNMLLWQARKLWGYLTMKNQSNAMKLLGVNKFQLDKFRTFVKHINLKFVASVFKLIEEIEIISKTMPEEIGFITLECFILSMRES